MDPITHIFDQPWTILSLFFPHFPKPTLSPEFPFAANSFILDRVTNITDFLGVARYIGWDEPHIETLELPDLEWVSTLVFGYLTAPRIYAPKLETVYDLRVNQDGIGTEALFPALKTATKIDIRGGQSRYVIP